MLKLRCFATRDVEHIQLLRNSDHEYNVIFDRLLSRRCLPDCLKSLNACLPTNLRALLKRYRGVYHE